MHKLILTLFVLFQSCFALAAHDDGRWHAGIGDPTIFGWITVIVYLAAVIRCIVKAKESKKYGGNYQFWFYLAVFLFFLGINKQLDLQSWLTQTLRDSSKMHGWYDHRRSVQIAFIALLGLGTVVVLIGLRLYLANSWRHYKLTWVGIVLLCIFILMRATSFHHFDIFINHHILGLRVNVILEVGALLLIVFGTYLNKKSVNLHSTITFPMDRYAEIINEGDDVQCPRCGVQPLANTVDGRLFKCRGCGNIFTVRVLNN